MNIPGYNDIVQNIAHSGSTQLLAKLFGTWIYGIFGNESTVAGSQVSLLSVLGASLTTLPMLLFGIIALYFILVSLTSAAQDGSFLKKEWNGVWSLLRLSLGLLAILPAGATGILFGQWLCVSVALFSSSITELYPFQ